ncbi:hypothetical protein GCM10010112_46750 [Actinoplanes lobatus]|uniref:Ferredoxin n=1 Tax=Actinoplanes lobatus TaxID=113568 RepID=A0A7W7HGK1_9ACTN|nr:ferredoxin [Actinoplanes lobatus]MBB4750159.1 hypothetical protein [Actinoplanes lobatus]GGN75474.1 hypothetical protein GCM10010112_46750 [Actinoplanes lobatus]GIE38954.1 hypothetical protein Alo02nite_18520 [Actinoplanes lobatus]
MISYWNPVPEARRIVAALDRDPFEGDWSQRNPRNVPGPFYTGETDIMQMGRNDAPRHICNDDAIDSTTGFEFVFRQPMTPAEVADLVSAAQIELNSGYALDGDDHWTPEAVRDWWAGRAGLRRWAIDLAVAWAANSHPEYHRHYHDAAQGLRDLVAFLDDGMESYLRGYLFWLRERREPAPTDRIPAL